MNDHELDAEFERIIAGWDDTADDPCRAVQRDDPDDAGAASAHHGPDTVGDGDGDPDVASGPATSLPKPGASLNLPISPGAAHVWRGGTGLGDGPDAALDQAPEDEDDHFVPPLVDLPTAEEDPMYWATLCSLAGGPLLLLYVILFDRGGSGWWVLTGVALTVLGFVMLVLRGGTERDPFDDGTRV